MKRIIMALLFSISAALPCPCQEKSGMVGVELTSFIYRQTEAGASYCFNKHWTVTGEASISYKGACRKRSDIETEHDSEFSSFATTHRNSGRPGMCASVSYWPMKAFSGPYMSVGVQSRTDFDAILDAGYMISVWKGVYVSAAFRIPVIRSIMQEGSDTRNLRIGLHYKFR